jgi:hypothetical protein
MTSYFFKTGNVVRVQPSEALLVLKELPVDTYTIKKDEMTNTLYLQSAPHMEIPSKIYGTPNTRVDRVCKTFFDRDKSTGILLSGDKGSGKTLLTKMLSHKLRQSGISTIIVNEPFCGPIFNDLISNISSPAMVLFDEFEKVYDEEEQAALLTLLDGTIETKKLFVLTTNKRQINEYLTNRPGRIYYSFSYGGISEEFIREYADDVLKNKGHIESLVSVSSVFSTFTFDMLSAIVEEMNRFDESAADAIVDLNMSMANESVSYDIEIFVDGLPMKNKFYPHTTNINPLFAPHGREIDVYGGDEGEDVNFKDGFDFILSQKNIKKVSSGGIMTFEEKRENSIITAVCSKKQDFIWDYRAF